MEGAGGVGGREKVDNYNFKTIKNYKENIVYVMPVLFIKLSRVLQWLSWADSPLFTGLFSLLHACTNLSLLWVTGCPVDLFLWKGIGRC